MALIFSRDECGPKKRARVSFDALGRFHIIASSAGEAGCKGCSRPNRWLPRTARIAEATHTKRSRFCASQRAPLRSLHTAATHRAAHQPPQPWPAQATSRKRTKKKNSQRKCNGSRPTSTAHSRTRRGIGKTISCTPYPPELPGSAPGGIARRRNPWSRPRTRRSVLLLVRNVKRLGTVRGSAK